MDEPEEVLGASMPFLEHLEELRTRLIRSLLFLAGGLLVSGFFARRIFRWMMAPLLSVLPEDQKRMIFTGVSEAFFTYFKVALVSGLVLASPLIFRELWLFIAPGLYKRERRFVLPFVLVSTTLFVTGAAFGYLQVFPLGFKFLLGFADDQIQPFLRVREYFAFSTQLLLAFGLVFELPVVIFFLARLGVVTPGTLARQRRYAALLAVTLSALLTPPDVITQLMMAGPVVLLYEVGILAARFFGLPPEERARREAERRTARRERKRKRKSRSNGRDATGDQSRSGPEQ